MVSAGLLLLPAEAAAADDDDEDDAAGSGRVRDCMTRDVISSFRVGFFCAYMTALLCSSSWGSCAASLRSATTMIAALNSPSLHKQFGAGPEHQQGGINSGDPRPLLIAASNEYAWSV